MPVVQKKNKRTNIFQFPGGGLGNQNPARTIAHSPPGVKEILKYNLREHSEHTKRTWETFFFPQPIIEGLLNSRRRVSDRPSWILTSKTPARKWKNEDCCFFVPQQGTKSCKEEILKETPYSSLFRNLRWNPILGTQIFLS